jgi:heavy metal sensor kinase
VPFSASARERAARGRRTFETIQLPDGERVRLVTMPVARDGVVTRILQVGIPLHRTERTLRRYAEALLMLGPLGVALAALGGALIARAALAPVHAMARSAREMTAEDLGRRLTLRGTGDELDYLADTLNAMLARLESAFAEIRRFAADAAHELRTPLTALKGGIEVALRASRSADEYRRVLESSLEEAERLITLAEELLLLSRSSARPDKPRSPVDLEALLLEVFDVGVELAQPARITVRLAGMVPATVRGDSLALRRALLNLVENALRYTPAGGQVELALAVSDGAALLTVEDTGPGIAPADAERVFEPFVRLEAGRMRNATGAGLGLTIARSIAIAHGGSLSVAPAATGGCRFTIRLPLA